MEKNTKVGDKIRITNVDSITGGRYKNGDILTVDSVSNGAVTVEEHNVIIFHEEYEVLGKMPKVGDIVEVVKPDMPAGRYDVGDILTVRRAPMTSSSGRRLIEVEEHDQPLYVEEVRVVGEKSPAIMPKTSPEIDALSARMNAIEASMTHLDALISQKADKHEEEAERDIQAEINDIEAYLVRKYPDADVDITVDISFEGQWSRTRI